MTIEKQLRMIADNIRDQRVKTDLSAAELAASIGLTPQYFRLIERDGRNFSVSVLLRIAEALGISIKELLRGIR